MQESKMITTHHHQQEQQQAVTLPKNFQHGREDPEDSDSESEDDDDHLLEMPPKRAMKSKFPPGYQTLYFNKRKESVSIGQVQNVFIDMASKERPDIFQIRFPYGNVKNVPEKELQFAPFSAVWVNVNAGQEKCDVSLLQEGFILMAEHSATNYESVNYLVQLESQKTMTVTQHQLWARLGPSRPKLKPKNIFRVCHTKQETSLQNDNSKNNFASRTTINSAENSGMQGISTAEVGNNDKRHANRGASLPPPGLQSTIESASIHASNMGCTAHLTNCNHVSSLGSTKVVDSANAVDKAGEGSTSVSMMHPETHSATAASSRQGGHPIENANSPKIPTAHNANALNGPNMKINLPHSVGSCDMEVEELQHTREEAKAKAFERYKQEIKKDVPTIELIPGVVARENVLASIPYKTRYLRGLFEPQKGHFDNMIAGEFEGCERCVCPIRKQITEEQLKAFEDFQFPERAAKCFQLALNLMGKRVCCDWVTKHRGFKHSHLKTLFNSFTTSFLAYLCTMYAFGFNCLIEKKHNSTLAKLKASATARDTWLLAEKMMTFLLEHFGNLDEGSYWQCRISENDLLRANSYKFRNMVRKKVVTYGSFSMRQLQRLVDGNGDGEASVYPEVRGVYFPHLLLMDSCEKDLLRESYSRDKFLVTEEEWIYLKEGNPKVFKCDVMPPSVQANHKEAVVQYEHENASTHVLPTTLTTNITTNITTIQHKQADEIDMEEGEMEKETILPPVLATRFIENPPIEGTREEFQTTAKAPSCQKRLSISTHMSNIDMSSDDDEEGLLEAPFSESSTTKASPLQLDPKDENPHCDSHEEEDMASTLSGTLKSDGAIARACCPSLAQLASALPNTTPTKTDINKALVPSSSKKKRGFALVSRPSSQTQRLSRKIEPTTSEWTYHLPCFFGVTFFIAVVCGADGDAAKHLEQKFGCKIELAGKIIDQMNRRVPRSEDPLLLYICGSTPETTLDQVHACYCEIEKRIFDACDPSCRGKLMCNLALFNHTACHRRNGLVCSYFNPHQPENRVHMALIKSANGVTNRKTQEFEFKVSRGDKPIVSVQEVSLHLASLRQQFPSCNVILRDNHCQKHPSIEPHVFIYGPAAKIVNACRQELYNRVGLKL